MHVLVSLMGLSIIYRPFSVDSLYVHLTNRTWACLCFVSLFLLLSFLRNRVLFLIDGEMVICVVSYPDRKNNDLVETFLSENSSFKQVCPRPPPPSSLLAHNKNHTIFFSKFVCIFSLVFTSFVYTRSIYDIIRHCALLSILNVYVCSCVYLFVYTRMYLSVSMSIHFVQICHLHRAPKVVTATVASAAPPSPPALPQMPRCPPRLVSSIESFY